MCIVSVLCDNLNGSWWDYRVVKVCQTEQKESTNHKMA